MGGGGSAPRIGRFNPRKDPVPIVQETGWAPGPVWTGAENLTLTGIRSPDRSARSKSLYWLSYREQPKVNVNLPHVLLLCVRYLRSSSAVKHYTALVIDESMSTEQQRNDTDGRNLNHSAEHPVTVPLSTESHTVRSGIEPPPIRPQSCQVDCYIALACYEHCDW